MSIKMMAAAITYRRELDEVFESGLKEYSFNDRLGELAASLERLETAISKPQIEVSMEFSDIQHNPDYRARDIAEKKAKIDNLRAQLDWVRTNTDTAIQLCDVVEELIKMQEKNT